MMVKRKWGQVILILLFCCLFINENIEVNAASTSGYCGEKGNEKSVTWSYSNGVLIIAGEGAMADYRDDDTNTLLDQPWKSVMNTVTEVEIKEGVTYIGSDAFSQCINLTKVSFPSTLTKIGNFAFLCCEKLNNVELPSDLSYMGQQCFSGCVAITTVSIPDLVTFIDAGIFDGCTNLKYVYIGGSENVGSVVVGNSPFRFCTSLEKIEVSEKNIGLKSVDGVLYNKENTILIQYPLGKKDKEYTMLKGCTSIFQFAIENALYLEEIHLSKELEFIGVNGITECKKLKYLIVPSNVLSIEEGFGDYCNSIEYIKNLSSIKIKVPVIEGKVGINKNGKEVSYIDPNETVELIDEEKVPSVQKKIKSIKAQKVTIKSIKNKKSKKIVLKLSSKGKGTGYQIQYAKNKKFKSAKKITKKTSTITLSKLTKNKKYYVRVRVYGKVNGKTYYGKWSKVKSIKIKK